MATYPTKLAEAFASQALEIFYRASVTDAITNSDYEGEIRDRSSVLNVLTFGARIAFWCTFGARWCTYYYFEQNALETKPSLISGAWCKYDPYN